jgi:hypothetical protein
LLKGTASEPVLSEVEGCGKRRMPAAASAAEDSLCLSPNPLCVLSVSPRPRWFAFARPQNNFAKNLSKFALPSPQVSYLIQSKANRQCN